MTGHHSNYEVLTYKILPPQRELGWRVLVIRKNGHQETWLGLNTKGEAEAWVAKQIAKRSQQNPKRQPSDDRAVPMVLRSFR
jgi:hypothetical protein